LWSNNPAAGADLPAVVASLIGAAGGHSAMFLRDQFLAKWTAQLSRLDLGDWHPSNEIAGSIKMPCTAPGMIAE
jgi:hypothetical protein